MPRRNRIRAGRGNALAEQRASIKLIPREVVDRETEAPEPDAPMESALSVSSTESDWRPRRQVKLIPRDDARLELGEELGTSRRLLPQTPKPVPKQRPQMRTVWEVHDVDVESRSRSPRPVRQPIAARVPLLDSREGGLLRALQTCSAVFVHGLNLEAPNYAGWLSLWREAKKNRRRFGQRRCVSNRHLVFSKDEDLQRTLTGEAKRHEPDRRWNFGSGYSALHADPSVWQELSWIRREFQETLSALSDLFCNELFQLQHLLDEEPRGTLASNILSGRETWAGSRLRHSIYPADGSCTEHTDYGVLTLQQTTGPGLEALLGGSWTPLDPPEGCVTIFAGDMLEVLSNGHVPALRHRVRCKDARQASIIFLQPDRDTVVQPMFNYARGDADDLPRVRYGDWHRRKASLAFGRQ